MSVSVSYIYTFCFLMIILYKSKNTLVKDKSRIIFAPLSSPISIIFLSSLLPDGRVYSWGGGEGASEPSPPKEEVIAFEEPRTRTQDNFKNFVRPMLVSLKQGTRGKVLSIAASRELVLLCHKS